MRETAKAIKTFASSFGLPAYTVDTVPDEITLPYLTYSLSQPEWDQKASFYIQGWYRSTSNTAMMTMADTILAEVGTGLTISTAHGYVVIYPDTPLVQTMVDGDIRSFILNFTLNSFHMPGV